MCKLELLYRLMITASHQTFSRQNQHLSGQIKFGQTNSLYVINGNFIEFAKNNECSNNIWSLLLALLEIYCVCPFGFITEVLWLAIDVQALEFILL